MKKDINYYMKLPYTIELIPDEVGYFIKIKELEGCMSQGDTQIEALKNIEEAKHLYLGVMLEKGFKIPKPEIMGNTLINLNRLSKSIHRGNKKKGFYDHDKNFGELIALMHSELSEALEDYREGKKPNKSFYEEDGKLCGIPSEFADCIIRILDVCGYYKIDIDKAIKEKLEYNKTRPYKHDKKF